MLEHTLAAQCLSLQVQLQLRVIGIWSGPWLLSACDASGAAAEGQKAEPRTLCCNASRVKALPSSNTLRPSCRSACTQQHTSETAPFFCSVWRGGHGKLWQRRQVCQAWQICLQLTLVMLEGAAIGYSRLSAELDHNRHAGMQARPEYGPDASSKTCAKVTASCSPARMRGVQVA